MGPLKTPHKTMKLLIAYDGSQCADSALDDLTHAGLPQIGEAHVMTVAETFLPPPPPSVYEVVEMAMASKSQLELEQSLGSDRGASLRVADEIAARAAARFASNFPQWKVSHASALGSPARVISSKAKQLDSDLILVGSHGRSALGRLLLGSISQQLLKEAGCSVRIARGKLDEPAFPVRILLGLDGSRNSKAALDQVVSRNWAPGSEVRVVQVDQPVEPTYLGRMVPPVKKAIKGINKEERKRLLRRVNAASKKLQGAGLRTIAEVADGDPKSVLVELAEEWRADCIFIGATGISNRLGFLLGSVAAAVAARAHCSVEVVRTKKRRRKENGNGKN